VKRRLLKFTVVAVMSLAGTGCGLTRPAASMFSTIRGPSLAQPLPLAHRMSLSAASRAVRWPVPQAHTAIAGPRNLTTVWVDKHARQVALVYGNGDVTITMAPATYRDRMAAFSTFRRENHATTKIGSIDGSVALVISPRTDSRRSNPAWVEFDENGIDINVVSHTRATAVLETVAQSLTTA
jgi:hypothetical protein